MTINISVPDSNGAPDLKPRITVIGVGGAGGNAVNNMIQSGLEGVDFVVANTDAQALNHARTDRRIQLGMNVTKGLGAGSKPDVGARAAEEAMDDILEHIRESNMVFITAGMGGGTGTGAAPVIARTARDQGILTVGVVTKPFMFEGKNRMRLAEQGIEELQDQVDTLIIIPNQNLFRVANEKTTFADAFKMADDVLHQGVRGVTDLMVMPGLINLDFADIESVMGEMGKAMMGTGEAEGEGRSVTAAEAAISNPLLEDTSISGAQGVLINITGGLDMTLFEVDEAANLIRDQVDPDANIIFGSTFDEKLEGKIRVSVVATGIESAGAVRTRPSVEGTTGGERRPLQVPGAEAAEPTIEVEMELPAGIEELLTEPKAETVAPVTQAEMEAPVADTVAPFIPPKPAEAEAAPAQPRQADPFAEAAIVNAQPPQSQAKPEAPKPAPKPKPVAERGPSLFERVTGTGWAKSEGQRVTPLKPSIFNREGGEDQAVETTAETTHQAGLAPRADERLSGSSATDDMLDIPAFLRRQSN